MSRAAARLAPGILLASLFTSPVHAQGQDRTASAEGPSTATVCPEGTGILGMVRDSLTGVELPEARIRLEAPGSRWSHTLRADEEGFYRLCDVPTGEPITLVGSAAGRSSAPSTIVVADGFVSLHHILLPLGEGGDGALGGLIAWVRDRDTGQPLSNAVVALTPVGVQNLTGMDGGAVFGDLAPGRYEVRTTLLGYAARTDTVSLTPGHFLRLRIPLTTEAIELEPLVVEVESRRWFGDMRGFLDRSRRGFGSFVTPEEIELRGRPPLHELVRGHPRVRVRKSGFGYRVFFGNNDRGPFQCEPTYYLDGVKYRLDELGLSAISGPDVEAVELYASAAEVPGEFSGSDAACGVVVIWTR